MSFNIFVSGTTGNREGGGRGHFHYSKDDCLDGDDFEPPALLSLLPGSPDAAGVAKKIAEEVAGTPASHLGSATVGGMTKIAEMQTAHLVRTTVDLLAMHGSGGEISVYCLQESWYWANSSSFVAFKIGSSSDPGRDFLRKIGPGLVKTELNSFGVLLQIAIALSKYDQALPGSASPLVSIELTH